MAKYRLRDEVRSQCVEFTPSELRSKFRRIFGSEHPFFAGSESKDSTFRRFFKEGTGIGEENFLEFCRFINLMKGWDLRFGDYCFDERELEQLDPSYRIEQARFDLQPVNPVMVDGEGAAVFRRDFSSLEQKLRATPPLPSKANSANEAPSAQSIQPAKRATSTGPDSSAPAPSIGIPLEPKHSASAAKFSRSKISLKSWVAIAAGLLIVVTFVSLAASGYFSKAGKSPVADPRLVVDVVQNDRSSVPLAEAKLPLIPGDGIRFSVTTAEPLYYYVFWLDPAGSVVPIFPWQDKQWGTRTSEWDRARTSFSLPEQGSKTQDEFLKLQADKPGLNAVLFLVRRTPLDADKEIQNALKGFSPAAAAMPLYSNITVEIDRNGIEKNHERIPLGDGVMRMEKNLLAQLQVFISERLAAHGDATNAICFSFSSVRDEN